MTERTTELTMALHRFGVARRALAETFAEFARQRRTAEMVRQRRLIQTDPTFVPYRFESAESRAERRRKLHDRLTPESETAREADR